MNKVYLKPKKEESLLRFHPWVFSGAIARVEGNPEEGEVVEVYTSDKQYIAAGHYQIGSIAVRVLTFKKEEINHEFWVRRLTVARDLRQALRLINTEKNNASTHAASYMARATISPDLSSTSTTIQPSCRPIRQAYTSTVMR